MKHHVRAGTELSTVEDLPLMLGGELPECM
eukprot:SAG31_NODE_27380_length_427_cov_0.570122_1_plen_29_part_10